MSRKEIAWYEMYEIAKLYFNEYGNLDVPYSFRTNDGITYDSNGSIRLGAWIYIQRKKCDPESEHGQMLAKINMKFGVRKKSKMTWAEMYQIAKAYYIRYGHLEVPYLFKTNDGFTYDQNGKINLGMWIATQRLRCNPESEEGQLLFKIGMRFEAKKKNMIPWNEMYRYAEIYFQKNGNLEVPTSFKTNDGFTYDQNGKINLGMWIAMQRERCNPESERGLLLLKIGMRFEKIGLSWDQWYEVAKDYYLEHGNLDVPNKYVTSDGRGLGNWIVHQKTLYNNGKLMSDQIEKLKKIKFKFEREYILWDDWYIMAKDYYLEHGNLEIPAKFITSDGYKLGRWLCKQKVSYKKGTLTQEHFDKLVGLGVNFEVFDPWKQWYEIAKDYYLEHGNLDVAIKFVTSDGCKLGEWINAQRHKYKRGSMSQEHIIMLESIGMIWNTRINKSAFDELFEGTNIDIEKNRIIVQHMSIIEFKVKLSYLTDNGISIVDRKGILHDIFSMSSINMEIKYGVSLEDLVNMYDKEKVYVKKK